MITRIFNRFGKGVPFVIQFLLLLLPLTAICQTPLNDDCANAGIIQIGNGGYGIGTFSSDTVNMQNATVQTGENFASAILVAGLDKKSVWFKFSLPTMRSIRVILSQPGTDIAAGDVGFAVYKSNACLPPLTDISNKLTPIATYGNTFHPCTDAGEYWVQVSSKALANGPIIVQVDVQYTAALYDRPAQPYDFGVMGLYTRYVNLGTECHSIENSTEICNGFANQQEYQKSAWFTFTTPSYFDYFSILLSSTGGYFPSTYTSEQSFGYTLYKGNVALNNFQTLPVIDGCDSLSTNGYYAAYKMYRCDELDTGTTYSIQLFFKKDFKDDIRVGLVLGGSRPTRSPEPTTASVTGVNAMGVLNASANGTLNRVTDVLACNSRFTNRSCSNAMPDTGVIISGIRYNLNSFFSFSLRSTSAVYFYATNTQCGSYLRGRIFKQALTANCGDLDMSNLIGEFDRASTLNVDCLPQGDYVIQILGTDSIMPYYYFNYGTVTNNNEQCLANNLGTEFRLDLTVYERNESNHFTLGTAGAFDSINVVNGIWEPIQIGGSYLSQIDTLGCANTLRPADTTCNPNNTKVIYRQFNVADSGIINFTQLNYPLTFRLYEGNASDLSLAQNIFNFPDSVRGLTPRTNCWDAYIGCGGKRVCMLPGAYTFASFGSSANIGATDRIGFNYFNLTAKHVAPELAQDMGSILDSLPSAGGNIISDTDFWTCKDNADTINGYAPLLIQSMPATKAIYRQFYLKEPALVSISEVYSNYCDNYAYGLKTLFKGKATERPDTLVPVGGQWTAFHNAATTNGCSPLDSGWYTVVSYASGPSYEKPFQALNQYGYSSYVGYFDRFQISITPTCKGPQYNRPHKASIDTVTHQPYLVQWGNRVGHTAAYPKTDTTIILATERFNCTIDTPFASHPIKTYASNFNRVAYYVFKTTQEAYVQINTSNYAAVLFNRDVRVDSNLFTSLTPIQPCLQSQGYIKICKMQPGVYTLVIFAGDNNSCGSVTPDIYIDKIGYSRFDFAKNAYDFGIVPPDSVYHYGKVGDVNPLDAGRKPSNDFFYCTTGAFNSDPADASCGTVINPNIYNTRLNNRLYDSSFLPSYGTISRRNLWYTFVINQPGWVKVKVDPKTLGKGYQYKFSVYKSNVNGTLPFSTVQSTGQIDSTLAQGLTHIVTNYSYYYCSGASNEVSFYRDPCNNSTERYYIVVENVNSYPYEVPGLKPNSQAEVAILVDSMTFPLPKFDHYYQANNLGAINNNAIYRGVTDNFSCATRDATDPTYAYGSSANKTLWYKFTTNLSGYVKYRSWANGANDFYQYQIQLFKQIIPGDSTSTGLAIQNTGGNYIYDNSTGNYWANTCVSPGTYYILLTGYSKLNEYVYPEVQIVEQFGDYCSKPVAVQLNGPSAVSTSLIVNCHTIGTDYGEFGPQLTCPAGANTSDYKSSWFRLDIGGTDVLDVTAFLVENTNASSTDIKYRLMNGNCGAMQEQSCVLDALTQNTYQCLLPGQSYYVQVFTPVIKNGAAVNGEIELRLSAIKHTDTCAPLTSCLATANFTTVFDCTTDRSVRFVNFSTYGTSITYNWSFGYNNQTSTAVSPSFLYPSSAIDRSYSVKLVVFNSSCGKYDSVTRVITIPGRPVVNLGSDIRQCNGLPYTLNATSHPGATYLWQNGSTNPTFQATTPGQNQYYVQVNYNNCISRDTINVMINPIIKRPNQSLVLCNLTDSVYLDAARGYGETYTWVNGKTTSGIYVKTPGTYWVSIRYQNCVVRDSFIVNTASAVAPLGNDTTVCLALGAYTLNATITGAIGYTWKNGTTNATLGVTTAGIYWVDIRFPNCTVRDSVTIRNFPAPTIQNYPATICNGYTYTTPWNTVLNTAGTYRDTLRYVGGCDSVYRIVVLTVRAKPNLGVDKTARICNGFSFNLNSLYVTTNLNPVWTIGGNTVTNPTAVNVSGIYQLIVTNSFGCTDTALVSLSVDARPNLGNDQLQEICPGFTTNLPALFTTTGLTSNWTLGSSVVSNPATVGIAGSYQLIATNPAGCKDTALVNVNMLPKPALGGDRNVRICPGFATDLTVLYNTTGLTTSWTKAGAVVANPSQIDSAGVYQLIVVNNSGCADTALVNVAFYIKPNLGPDVQINQCTGTYVNLNTLYSTTGLTASWTIATLPVNNPQQIAIAGNYEIQVSNASGCRDTALAAIFFYPKPNIGNDTAVYICPGFATSLSSLYDTTNLQASWTKNGQTISDSSNVSLPGSYQIIVTNRFGCTDTAVVQVILYSKPNLGADVAAAICPGFTIDINTLYNLNTWSYSWTKNNSPVINPQAIGDSGVYQLIVTNADGCSDTAITAIRIYPKPALGNDTTLRTCSGFAVNLNQPYNLSGLTSQWFLNNSIVPNPTQVFQLGTYQLEVTNTDGCKDTALVYVVINPQPPANRDTVLFVCPGFSLNLNPLYNTTGLQTTWSLSNNILSDVTSVNTPGIYQLITENSFGCKDTVLVTIRNHPKPNLGPDDIAGYCPGFSTNLSSLYNTTGLTATWMLGTQVIANPSQISTPGIYQLTVLNSTGCADTALVTVTQFVKPNVGADKQLEICRGNFINLNTQYVTAGLSTSWTLSGLAVTQPLTVVDITGTYQLEVRSPQGCKDTAIVNLVVHPKPNIGADVSRVICPGGIINLDTIFVTSGLQVRWTLNNFPITNTSNVSNPGNYQLIVSNQFGCTDTAFVQLIVDQHPVLVVNDPAALCEPQLADLTLPGVTAGSASGLRFTYWNDNSLTSPLLVPNQVTTGTYFIRAENNNGCASIAPVQVTVYPKIKVDAGADTTICFNTAAILRSVVSNASGTVNYQWEPANLLTGANTNITRALPDSTREFIVRVRDNYGCGFEVFDTVKVTVLPKVIAYAGNDTIVSTNLPHQLLATGGVSYLWSPANVLNNATIANPIAIVSRDTRMIVQVKNALSCSAYDTIWLRVLPGINYYVPNAFSPNGDGVNDVFRATSVGIVSTQYFRIFNRYGELVFETNQIGKGWDGTFKNKPQAVGNYVWVIKGIDKNGKSVERKGNLVLIR